MFEEISKSELPNPQKGLTKLTKGVVRGAFVSFVSGFLHPQIAKKDVLPPSRHAELSFTRFVTPGSVGPDGLNSLELLDARHQR
jgi:hypothetical protein